MSWTQDYTFNKVWGCAYVKMHCGVRVEVKGALVGVCSLLLPHGLPLSNLSYWTRWQVPLPTETSQQPHLVFLKINLTLLSYCVCECAHGVCVCVCVLGGKYEYVPR